MTDVIAEPSVDADRPQDQLAAAKAESAPGHKYLTVSGKKFRLVKKLGLSAAADLDDAQHTGRVSDLIGAAAKLVHKSERDSFVEFLLDEPDDEDQEIDVDKFLEIFQAAVEAITGRPTSSTDS